MRDFDDFFAERLEEEASFPKRSKNWKQLSKNLDAFDAGMAQSPSSALRWWQASTVIAILSAGMLLWKNLESRRENQTLRNTIANLQQAIKPSGEITPYHSPAPPASNATLTPPVVSDLVQPPSSFSAQTCITPKIAASPAHFESKSLPDNASGSEAALPAPANTPAEPTATQLPPTIPADAAIVQIEQPASLTDSTRMFAQSGQTSTDSSTTAVATADTTVLDHPAADTVATAIAKNTTVHPFHTQKDKFRIGAQATLGMIMPAQPGVKALRGQGFNFEARLFGSLWATAGIDWLQHEVSTTEFIPKFHPRHDTIPRPPGHGGGGGPHHPPKLILVESTPRQQHLSLGLRYELPVAFWVKPSLRLSHTWVRVSPTLVTYKFEDNDPGWPGGPGGAPPRHEYTAEKFDARWHQNQWRLGLGLEKSITDWTFVVSADYSRDFSVNTPSFDALYLRAGAQYRF